jgi:glycosyltransferase involved in cell wall biosynthesis
MPDASFLLVGDGPERARIERTCRELGVANVTCAGRLTSAEVQRRLCGAKVFLSTSRVEGTPTAVLEAMACGLPVVTSRSNDYRDLIRDGENGFVVDGFLAADYAARIGELLADDGLRGRVGARNREAAREHGWANVARRVSRWFEAA